MNKFGVLLSALLVNGVALASNIGLSTHPLEVDKQVFKSELSNSFSEGQGNGIELSYLYVLTKEASVDAGIEVSDGDQSSKLYVASTYEFFPDYDNQPRMTVKGAFERSRLDGDGQSSFMFAPTLSKGMSAWGQEIFPYVAVPLRFIFTGTGNNTRFGSAFTIGASTPINGLSSTTSVLANIETTINLRNSMSAIALGIGFNI